MISGADPHADGVVPDIEHRWNLQPQAVGTRRQTRPFPVAQCLVNYSCAVTVGDVDGDVKTERGSVRLNSISTAKGSSRNSGVPKSPSSGSTRMQRRVTGPADTDAMLVPMDAEWAVRYRRTTSAVAPESRMLPASSHSDLVHRLLRVSRSWLTKTTRAALEFQLLAYD